MKSRFDARECLVALDAVTGASATGSGERWMDCPECGKGGRHFSYSERGAFCFRCGYAASLPALRERLGACSGARLAPKWEQSSARKPRRKAIADMDWWARQLHQTPGAFDAWTRYKPISRSVFEENMLGYGVMPALRYSSGGKWLECKFNRLIVPLFKDGRVVGFRCRAIEPGDAGPKWLSPGGSELTLYNACAVTPSAHIAIVENPIDALLATSAWKMPFVATMGVSIWKQEYTEFLIAMRPLSVTVMFDNDAPGNSIDPEVIRDWETRHYPAKAPQRGIALANHLCSEGLPARLHVWVGRPVGFDVGDLFHVSQD